LRAALAIVIDDVSVSPPGLPAGCHVTSQNKGQANLNLSNLFEDKKKG
jgi:hypothetical protein